MLFGSTSSVLILVIYNLSLGKPGSFRCLLGSKPFAVGDAMAFFPTLFCGVKLFVVASLSSVYKQQGGADGGTAAIVLTGGSTQSRMYLMFIFLLFLSVVGAHFGFGTAPISILQAQLWLEGVRRWRPLEKKKQLVPRPDGLIYI